MNSTIRPYRSEDLGRVLKLWERTGEPSDGLTVDQAVDLMNSDLGVALVAEGMDGELVGATLGALSGVMGWIYNVAVLPDKPREVAQQLLEQLEARLAEQGARKLVTVMQDGHDGREHLERRGYEARERAVYLERQLPAGITAPTALSDVGGRMIELGLWDKLRGMEEPKQVIERRVILPLAEPDLASRHSVSTPKAIMLFGPPGTGKTSFAKGIAARLDWAFVEISPGDLAGEGTQRQAILLAQTFDKVLRLPSAVVFVDEVEELASIRQEQRKVGPSVTNEFLKQITRFHETAQHLLMCATNFVSHLDPAFLRPGRFNYVLPIGPPDAEARAAMWQPYVRDITDEDIDIAALVKATELFTPADIEFAARQAAHKAFEREHFHGGGSRATTQDFLDAIEATRPSLTEEMVENFERDARRHTRY